MDGRFGERRRSLLPRARQHVFDRVRQHPEQCQSHSLRVARLQRRLGRRPAGGTLPELSAPSACRCALKQRRRVLLLNDVDRGGAVPRGLAPRQWSVATRPANGDDVAKLSALPGSRFHRRYEPTWETSASKVAEVAGWIAIFGP